MTESEVRIEYIEKNLLSRFSVSQIGVKKKVEKQQHHSGGGGLSPGKMTCPQLLLFRLENLLAK